MKNPPANVARGVIDQCKDESQSCRQMKAYRFEPALSRWVSSLLCLTSSMEACHL